MDVREEVLQVLGTMTDLIRQISALTDPSYTEYETVSTERVMSGVQAMYPEFERYLKWQFEAQGREYVDGTLSAADLADIFTRGKFIIDNNDGTCEVVKFMLKRFEFSESGEGADYNPGDYAGPKFPFPKRG